MGEDGFPLADYYSSLRKSEVLKAKAFQNVTICCYPQQMLTFPMQIENQGDLTMATNRYGIIKHGSYRDCKLKFPSPQARQDFSEKFSEYHASHDHDGDPPTYENVNASVVAPAGLRVHDIDDVTIDGWATYEIEEYHEDKDRTYVSYEPPTCCVAPTLSLGRKTFIPSDAFQRHELSAIFGDMPDPDYKSLLESVQRDGFIENIIKLLDGEILDGWHRYRAAQDLNLLRKLRFQVWNPDEHRDGDPKAFVLARNIERRHLGASQRAQIAVVFNERFGHGGDRSESKQPNGHLKTRKELAKQANVGEGTIGRAVQVEKAGQSETVIAGKKTASKVIAEREARKLLKQKEQAVKSLWDTRVQAATNYTGDADSDLNMHFTLPELEKAFAKHNPASADAFESAMRRTSCQTFKIALDKVLESDVSLETLATERIAMATYANEIRDSQRADGWILPLIEAKKAEVETQDQARLTELEDFLKGHWQSHLNWDGLSIDELSEEYSCAPSVIYTVMEKVRKCMSPREDEGDGSSQDTDNDSDREKAEANGSGEAESVDGDSQPSDSDASDPDDGVDSGTDKAETLLEEAQDAAGEALRMLWTNCSGVNGILNHVSEEAFAVAAAKAFNCYKPDDYESGENYLLEKDYALIENLTLNEAQTWKSRFQEMKAAVVQKADWVVDLMPDPKLDALKSDLAETPIAETPISEQKTVADVLGENTLQFITVCLRNPPTAGSAKGKLEYISFDDRDSFATKDSSFSEIPEALLIQLLEIAVKVRQTDV